jgi:Transposase
MIVIGVDVHKQSVTAVGIDEAGRMLDERTIPVGGNELLGWAESLGKERLWAVEDCRRLTRWLERQLLTGGEELVRVPPKLMASERRAGRGRGKSDAIDALAVARAALREPALGRPRPDEEPFRELKLLVDHRDAIVDERRRVHQRLRWHLHQLDPSFAVPLRMLARKSQLELGQPLARSAGAGARGAAGAGTDRVLPLARPHHRRARPRARAANSRACAGAARAARLRPDHGREAARRDRTDRTLPKRRAARPPQRRRPARGELRSNPTAPTRPRRQLARDRHYGLAPRRSDEQVDRLVAATETLAQLVMLLQERPIR